VFNDIPGSSQSFSCGPAQMFVGQRSSLNLASHVGEQDSVPKNRLTLERQLGCQIQWLQQVHGTAVFDSSAAQPLRKTFEEMPSLTVPVADAVITNLPGRALAILTADCLPVMFTDKNGHCVAAAHAGWRGLVDGVLENTIQAFEDKGINSTSVKAFFGPAIGPLSFEVGAEVRASFLSSALASEKDAVKAAFLAASFAVGQGPKFWCDLAALAQTRLNRFGVECINNPMHQDQLQRQSQCTYLNPRLYYSYRYFCHQRAAGQSHRLIDGRQVTLIWLPHQ
jgi:polyphenol oxidase